MYHPFADSARRGFHADGGSIRDTCSMSCEYTDELIDQTIVAVVEEIERV